MRPYLALLAAVALAPAAHAIVVAQTFSFERTPSWRLMTRLMGQASALGLDAIWIPPAYKASTGGYSIGYDPYDRYDLGDKFQQGSTETLWGSRAELETLIKAAHDEGIMVFADVVLNHNGAGMNYTYPDFSYTDFHHSPHGCVENC